MYIYVCTYICICIHVYGLPYIYTYICIWPYIYICIWPSMVAQTVNNLSAMQETWIQSLGQEDLPEKGMATLLYSCLENHTEEPGGLQAMGSQRVRHD